jgi:hypothetical protein
MRNKLTRLICLTLYALEDLLRNSAEAVADLNWEIRRKYYVRG